MGNLGHGLEPTVRKPLLVGYQWGGDQGSTGETEPPLPIRHLAGHGVFERASALGEADFSGESLANEANRFCLTRPGIETTEQEPAHALSLVVDGDEAISGQEASVCRSILHHIGDARASMMKSEPIRTATRTWFETSMAGRWACLRIGPVGEATTAA